MGDSDAQMQMALLYNSTFAAIAERFYGKQWRFWSKDKEKDNWLHGYDLLSNAGQNGNADAKLLSSILKLEKLDENSFVVDNILYDKSGFNNKFYLSDSDESEYIDTEEIIQNLLDSAKSGNDIAAYRYWMMWFPD